MSEGEGTVSRLKIEGWHVRIHVPPSGIIPYQFGDDK